MVESLVKRFPAVGACGLDCGLCPRHHTEGVSRCPGCAAETYAGPGCALQRCCVREHGLECCAECSKTEGCTKLGKVLEASAATDSFISYLPVPENHRLIRELGIGGFARRQDERIAFLGALLRGYDDGRSKGFYCLAVQLLPLDQLQAIVDRLSPALSQVADARIRAAALRAAFGELASQKGLTLKLRRPKKEAG